MPVSQPITGGTERLSRASPRPQPHSGRRRERCRRVARRRERPLRPRPRAPATTLARPPSAPPPDPPRSPAGPTDPRPAALPPPSRRSPPPSGRASPGRRRNGPPCRLHDEQRQPVRTLGEGQAQLTALLRRSGRGDLLCPHVARPCRLLQQPRAYRQRQRQHRLPVGRSLPGKGGCQVDAVRPECSASTGMMPPGGLTCAHDDEHLRLSRPHRLDRARACGAQAVQVGLLRPADLRHEQRRMGTHRGGDQHDRRLPSTASSERSRRRPICLTAAYVRT